MFSTTTIQTGRKDDQEKNRLDLIEPEVNLRHSKTKVGWWDINGNKSADTEQTGVILTFEIRP